MLSQLKNLFFIPIVIGFSIQANAQSDINDIVSKVRENSLKSYDYIDSISFKAHSKAYIYFNFSPFNVKMVPYLEEYYLDGYWMKPDSVRYSINAIRVVNMDSNSDSTETGSIYFGLGNQLPLPNPFNFTYNPSAFTWRTFSETEEKFKDVKSPIFPFSPGADSLYNFDIVSEIGINYKKILEVRVSPKDPSMPAVEGIFRIDPDEFVIVGSDLVHNDAASVTKSAVGASRNSLNISVAGSENHRVKTKKALLHSEFWLPETIEEEFEVIVMGMKLKIFREIKFDSYRINPPEPEADVLTDAKVTFNRDPVKEAEVFNEGERPNRLSRAEEEKLIKFIENEFIAGDLVSEGMVSPVFSEALKNTAPGRFTKNNWGTIRGLSNLFKYNRVEGLRAGTGFIFYPRRRNDLMFSVNGAYGFSDKKWKGSSGFAYFTGKDKRLYIETGLFRDTAFEEDRTRITDLRNTLSSLVSNTDYRDFYYKEGGYIGFGARFYSNISANLTYYSRSETNAENNTKFSVFHPSEIFRFNPEIKEGYYRGLSAGLSYKTYNADASLKIDYTDKDALSSDFSFFRALADLRLFYKPAYFSSLNYRLSAGVSNGKLPPQYWFDFGGKLFLDYTGRLRGTGYKAFTGDRFAASVLEYSLSGSWLRDKGLRLPLMRILKFTLWGGAGWSDLDEKNLSYAANIFAPVRTTDGTYHEFGFGVGDALNIFRIDFIRNSVSKNSIQIGFNFLR